MKKRMIIIIAALCVILAIIFICYSQLVKNERKVSYTDPVITTETDSTQQNTTENSVTYLAEFKPFECSGEYYCYDSYHLKDRFGNAVSYTYDEESKIYALTICDIEIFRYNIDREYYVGLYSIIDDCVYISVHDILYRIELTYTNDGIPIDYKLYLVSKQDRMHPIKAYDNTLILYRYDGYYQLNTLDGVINETDFNTSADPAEINPKISYDKACDLAFKAVEDINNYEPEYTQPYKASDYYLREDFSELIKNPNLESQNVIHERYPEYVWIICLHTDEYGNNFNIEVFINADTGKVSAMSIYDMGC